VSDPWRKRCPEGHTAVTTRQTGGYYCQTCQARYAGEPHDAAADDAPDAPDVRWSYDVLEAVGMLYRETRDTETAVRARRVSDRPAAFGQTMRKARNRGLVEKVSAATSAGRYRVTETGERVAAQMVPQEAEP
jgi:hypothetical protein